MGQKVNPISNRLGIIRGWDSNWYGGNDYGDALLEDSKIRKYLNARLAKASVSRIVIERTLKLVTITVCTARPGIIIGKGGQEVDKLKEELKKITDKDIQINIFENICKCYGKCRIHLTVCNICFHCKSFRDIHFICNIRSHIQTFFHSRHTKTDNNISASVRNNLTVIYCNIGEIICRKDHSCHHNKG